MKATFPGRFSGRRILQLALLVCNVLLVYSNHFRNDFHFDDLPAITQNQAIRHGATMVRAFVNPTLFSAAPEQRTYRPVTTASLALDYWLAGGYNTFFFHLSTFVWFAVQLVLMFLLFEWVMDRADPHPSNAWTALLAATVYGFHPANAETLNYIIQRADLYNALGCVAGLWLFIRYPSQRKFGWYLLPPVLASLAKAPALIFPLLLLGYVWLFELGESPAGRKVINGLRAILPSVAIAGATGWLLGHMQPAAWKNGAASPSLYRITQPWVALHYFKSFFLPTELSVDAGWRYLTLFNMQAIAGYLFVLALAGIAVAAARRRPTKPVAFGILWFLAALLPTSLMPLGDVMNDHRMFFPFVGLTLAVVWTVRLELFRKTDRLRVRPHWIYGSMAAALVVLLFAAQATRERNQIWLTEPSLWHDATLKNPQNSRAWTNNGAYAYAQADYQTALSSWEISAALDPQCASCESNLVRVAAQLHRPDLSERHLQKLLAMNPPIPDPYIVYADLLGAAGRFEESRSMLDRAVRLYPDSPEVLLAHRRLLLLRDAADRIPLMRALDTDHDTSLSAEELIAAPQVLLQLDRNGDGKLSAEECGANFGDETLLTPAFLRNVRREFIRSNPLLRALDVDGDGEISAAEIREAASELAKLDHDGDGRLATSEIIPGRVLEAARRVMAQLDANHDGKINAPEWAGAAGEPYRSLLAGADLDGNGIVDIDELTNEIFYRADQDKNGIVTAEEMERTRRSGVLGPLHRN